jgi:predicted nucleotidyltransferase
VTTTAARSHPPGTGFACEAVPEDTYVGVLRRVAEAVDATGLPWAVIGGIAAALHGRPRWTYDIDLFVQPHDARAVLDALAGAGFDTEERDEQWLFKAIDQGVLVDVIFRATADIYLDDRMIARVRRREFRGVSLPVVSAEDLVVIKATAFREHSARHWWDALGVLIRQDLDWEYLLWRARHSTRRVASLLLFAQSLDIAVPAAVGRRITSGGEATGGGT